MNYKRVIILFLCSVLLVVAKAAVIDIKIDSTFSSKDIYNALQLANSNMQSFYKFDLLLEDFSGKDQQLYLSVINPTVDKIVIYDGNDSIVLGDYVSFTKRAFKHVNHIYPLVLPAGSIQKLSVRVYNPFQHPLNFRLNLSKENAFIKTTNHDNLLNGFFYGIFFMYLLLLICFYIFSKSNFFTIYLAINFFALILMMQYNGTGYQFIWFYSATVQKHITVFSGIGYLTAHVLFIRTFFAVQLRNFSKYLFNIFLSIIGLFALLLLAKIYNRTAGYVSGNYYYILVNVFYLLYGSMVLILSMYAYAESKNREVLWVFVGMLLHIVNWAIFINNEFAEIHWLNYLDNFQLFSSNIFLPHLNYCVCLLEIFTVTVFISFNYHILIRQNNLSSQRLDFLQKININTFVIGQEEERERISKEIHADILKDIQVLRSALAAFHPQRDEKKVLPVVLSEIDKTLSDIDNITNNYVAPDIQKMNLTKLISTAMDKLSQQIQTEYLFNDLPNNFRLSPIANINLYRIFQELSNNALKHSGASNMLISAKTDNKTLQIKINDNGVGFESMKGKNKGIGLMNIESRMNSLNGNFHVMSNAKFGTTIHLIMNLKDIT